MLCINWPDRYISNPHNYMPHNNMPNKWLIFLPQDDYLLVVKLLHYFFICINDVVGPWVSWSRSRHSHICKNKYYYQSQETDWTRRFVRYASDFISCKKGSTEDMRHSYKNELPTTYQHPIGWLLMHGRPSNKVMTIP